MPSRRHSQPSVPAGCRSGAAGRGPGRGGPCAGASHVTVSAAAPSGTRNSPVPAGVPEPASLVPDAPGCELRDSCQFRRCRGGDPRAWRRMGHRSFARPHAGAHGPARLAAAAVCRHPCDRDQRQDVDGEHDRRAPACTGTADRQVHEPSSDIHAGTDLRGWGAAQRGAVRGRLRRGAAVRAACRLARRSAAVLLRGADRHGVRGVR